MLGLAFPLVHNLPSITIPRKPSLILPAPHSVWLPQKGLHAPAPPGCATPGLAHGQPLKTLRLT